MNSLAEIRSDLQIRLNRFGTFDVILDDDMIVITSSSNSVLHQSILSFIVNYCNENVSLKFQVSFFDNKPELLIYA